MRSIRDADHEVVPLLDLLRKKPERAIALTFDDALESVATEAAPLLRTLVAPAALFVATGHLGKDNRWPGQDPNVPAAYVVDVTQASPVPVALHPTPPTGGDVNTLFAQEP